MSGRSAGAAKGFPVQTSARVTGKGRAPAPVPLISGAPNPGLVLVRMGNFDHSTGQKCTNMGLTAGYFIKLNGLPEGEIFSLK